MRSSIRRLALLRCYLHTLIMLGWLSMHAVTHAAEVIVSSSVARPTPRVLAYNLGHFYPGSNAADWWRYSRASGARIFLNPAHIHVAGTERPGDQDVVDQTSFLARRAALSSDPLNEDYINWPVVLDRFNTDLTGNNRIVPSYALGKIHEMGGDILAQMTLGAGAFPIANEDDWAGKWVAWRTYYTAAFYLAREFGVERFTSHNEPDHTNSFIEPAPWLMRLRLAADAVQQALADVNRIYEKNLEPRFNAPVTAGSTGSSFNSYGRPAVEGIQTDFLGESPPGFQLFQQYAYQRYNLGASGFASDFLDLRSAVNSVTPAGIAPLPFAITEYNVHTGATYDGQVASSHTLSKAVTFGGITTALTESGMEELYAFKFGMTAYPSTRNFPIQKNGMAFSDNNHAPHNYGTMGRSAEVYRLFNKGFAPGRNILAHSISGTGASSLRVLVSHDPVSDFYYIFSVNESGSSVPLDIDLSALDIPDGNLAIIEDVSQWRTGIVRSIEEVSNGSILPGNQPAQTVWLLSIPGQRQITIDDSPMQVLSVSKDTMVRDGIHASTNYGTSESAYARHDDASADERSAIFLQFDLGEDMDLDGVQFAILSLPVAARDGGNNIHAHLYGIGTHDWEEHSLTWQNAPNLRQDAPLGREIRHSVVEGAGETAHILGQITAGSTYALRQIDVTDYLRTQSTGKASFLIAQEPRWDVDINVSSMPASWDDLETGDLQADALAVRTREAAASATDGPHLIIVRRTLEPDMPGDVMAQAFSDRVELHWSVSADTEETLIRRSATSGGPYEEIAVVSGNTYIDAAVDNGQDYFYVLIARNAFGQSEPSAELAVKVHIVLPFVEDFENRAPGDLHGQNHWESDGVVVQSERINTGQRAGEITEPAGYMRQRFAGSESRVWTDLFLQPVFADWDGELPDPDATTALMFHSDGHPVVYDGQTPRVLDDVTVTTGAWIRVTFLSDHTEGQWDLYINEELVAENLGFYNTNTAHYSGLKIEGAGEVSALVDDIRIGLSRPWGNVDVTENYAVPHDWLLEFFPELSTPEEFEAAALDVDANGIPIWQKYWTGMNPLDPDSVLRIRQVLLQNGQVTLRWEHDAAAPDLPPIAIQMRTNLLTGSWQEVGQFVPVNGQNSWTNMILPNAFYRFAVTNAPAAP